MIDQNALTQWMDFYKNNGLAPPDYGPGDSFGGAGMGMNRNQAALQFALRMAQQNQQPSFGMPNMTMPNFFSGYSSSPAAATTIGDNPITARVNALFAQQRSPGVADQMGNNYLARLLK